MPAENGQQGKDNPYADKLRQMINKGETGDKVNVADPALVALGTDAEAGGHLPGPEEVATAIKEETKPVARTAQGLEQFSDSPYVESNIKKAIVMFSITLVIALIVLAAIYMFWRQQKPAPSRRP